MAIVHDYLTQRGGAERVFLLLARRFPPPPSTPRCTTPLGTFPEFAGLDIQTIATQQVRLPPPSASFGLSLLSPVIFGVAGRCGRVAFAARVDGPTGQEQKAEKSSIAMRRRDGSTRRTDTGSTSATPWPADTTDVPQCSQEKRRSCRAPAIGAAPFAIGISMQPSRLIGTSRVPTVMADAIRSAYGLEAEVLPLPPALAPKARDGRFMALSQAISSALPRLLPYKNVQVVAEAVGLVPDARLVIVGDGPARSDIEAVAGQNVRFLGQVDDATLRWLYRNALADRLRLLRGLWADPT